MHMRHALYLSGIVFFSASYFSAVEAADPAFEVTEGEVYYEYSPRDINNTFALANVRRKSIGSQSAPFYYNPRTMDTDNRLYRVHVPLKIFPARHDLPDTATIAYQFVYKIQVLQVSGRDKRLREFTRTGPFRTETIPLSKGVTEWTISSDWLVQCDRDLWDPSSAWLIENYKGQRQLTRTVRSKDMSYSSVAQYYFPFTLSYWDVQDGFRSNWMETHFPRLVLREVEGNERYVSHTFELFTGNTSHGAAGTANLTELRKVSQELLMDWDNPYRTGTAFSNTWERKPWAATIRKLKTQRLRAAFLARIAKQSSDDIDAHDLLLQSLAKEYESEKASRIYLKCLAKWPEWHEHWFRTYLSGIEEDEIRRAALIAYIRDNPDSGYAHEELVKSLINASRWSTAKRLITTWERLEPSNAHVYASAALIAEAESRESDERAAVHRTIVCAIAGKRADTRVYKEGSPAHTWYLRGRNQLLADKPSVAQSRLRRSLAYDAEYFPAHLTMGYSYLLQGLTASAKDYFEQALNVYSNHPAALAGLARVYANAGRNGMAARYRARVWKTLKPFAEHEVTAGNWTNAAEITRYITDTAGTIPEAVIMHATALIKLGMYEQASSVLFDLPDDIQSKPETMVIWADFCRTLQDDMHCVIIADRPLKWQAKAEAAWKKVLKAHPDNNRARFELMLIALANDDTEQAYNHLQNLYDHMPSPELADWLSSLCLYAAEENPYRTLPLKSDRSFIDEARNYYQRSSESLRQDDNQSHGLLEAHSMMYSPQTYIGLAEAARKDKVESGNPASIIRQGLRRFPGAPELHGALLQQYAAVDVTAPKLWIDYTNVFSTLRPLDYGIHSAMADIYEERRMYPNLSDAVARMALSEIFWAGAVYGDVASQDEVSSPYHVYTLASESGFRFKLVKHVFLDPVAAYTWYAFRSRYTEYDIRHGLTRWWQKRLLLVNAYNNLQRAVEKIQGGPANAVMGMLEAQYSSFQLRKRGPPDLFYERQLRNYFYQSVTASKGTFVRLQRPRERYTNTVSTALVPKNLDDIPMAPILHCRQSLPPRVRPRYVSPSIARALFPVYEWDRVSPAWAGNYGAPRPQSSFSWPHTSTQLVTWAETTHDTFAANVSFNRFSLYQLRTILHTSSWKQVGIIPLTAEKHVPVFTSFFRQPFNGAVHDIMMQQADINPNRQPELSLVIATAPVTASSEDWYDEALTLRFTWDNPTNCTVRVYAKQYLSETAMQPDTPGITIGTYPLQNNTSLFWKIDRYAVRMGSSESNLTHRFSHDFSPFAWTQGCCLGIQSCTCPTPAAYTFSTVTLSQEKK